MKKKRKWGSNLSFNRNGRSGKRIHKEEGGTTSDLFRKLNIELTLQPIPGTSKWWAYRGEENVGRSLVRFKILNIADNLQRLRPKEGVGTARATRGKAKEEKKIGVRHRMWTAGRCLNHHHGAQRECHDPDFVQKKQKKTGARSMGERKETKSGAGLAEGPGAERFSKKGIGETRSRASWVLCES